MQHFSQAFECQVNILLLYGHSSTAGPILLQPNLAGQINEYVHNSNTLSWYVKSVPTQFTKTPPLPSRPAPHCLDGPGPSPAPLDRITAAASYQVTSLQSCLFNGVFQRQPSPRLPKEPLLSFPLKSLFRLIRIKSPQIPVKFAGRSVGLLSI